MTWLYFVSFLVLIQNFKAPVVEHPTIVRSQDSGSSSIISFLTIRFIFIVCEWFKRDEKLVHILSVVKNGHIAARDKYCVLICFPKRSSLWDEQSSSCVLSSMEW